jgi:hypothetical protein
VAAQAEDGLEAQVKELQRKLQTQEAELQAAREKIEMLERDEQGV